MQNGFLLMMCRSNPNGIFTVLQYPHLECQSPVWNSMLPVMLIYLLLVGCLFLVFGGWTVVQQAAHVGATGLKSRGPWGLISQDYRVTHLYWPLILQIKDIGLNLIAAVFGILGDGMLQLVFAGAMNLFYGVEAILEQPTVAFSNTVNEAWMSLSIFSIIFMSAATGLQENPSSTTQTENYYNPDGTPNKEYALRENMMFAVQICGLLGPALVVVVQLLMVRPATIRLLPRCVLPPTAEKKQMRGQYFQSVLVDRGYFDRLMSRFDDHDFQQFNALLSSTSASVGIIDPETKSWHPSRYLRTLLKKHATDSPLDAAGGARDKAEGATISV